MQFVPHHNTGLFPGELGAFGQHLEDPAIAEHGLHILRAFLLGEGDTRTDLEAIAVSCPRREVHLHLGEQLQAGGGVFLLEHVDFARDADPHRQARREPFRDGIVSELILDHEHFRVGFRLGRLASHWNRCSLPIVVSSQIYWERRHPWRQVLSPCRLEAGAPGGSRWLPTS